MNFHLRWFVIVLLLLSLSCKNTQPTVKPVGYQGQGPTPLVSTASKPIQKQWKGTWALNDSTVFLSNEFDGARLNGAVHDGDNHYTLWFTAENTPINPSPWYGFTIWSETPQEVVLKFTYQDSRSRYYPKISRDGLHFKALDSIKFRPINLGEGEFGLKAAPEFVEITMAIDEKPTWITAQELYTSGRVKQWVDSLSKKAFVSSYAIGKSRERRPIDLMEINEGNSKKALIIITFQHPPEVTGFLAMKAFMETLTGDSERAKAFRKQYTIFNVPLINPDGVDNGHWRHNAGGIDLNRDWADFNQPETQAVRDLLQKKQKEGYEFVFGIDFHSTWDDIYYPLDTVVTGEKGQLVFDWIARISERLPSKRTNISASKKLKPTMVSRNYFFATYGMPAIVFELGDNTPRPFLKEKGKVAAEELMRLLME
ncbi:MAG: M14 family metallopeptidase [Bacteroidota bacterium]